MSDKCQCLSDFMKAQRDIVSKHLDEHKWLRHIEDRNEAVLSFIDDYGFLMREMYCTGICQKRNECSMSLELNKTGDLLKNRIKEG